MELSDTLMNDMVSSNALHRITVAEYRRMDEAGVFAPDSRIELIEGELFERLLPMNPPHAITVGFLNRFSRLGSGIKRTYVLKSR